MTIVLLDANVLFDVWLKREHSLAAVRTLDLVVQGNVHGYVSGHTVSIFYYVLKKSIGDQEARQTITNLLKKVKVAATTEGTVTAALLSPISDFEDGLVVANAIEIGAEAIVTRNIKDFKKSPVRPVPSMLPEMFNKRMAGRTG